MRDLYARVFTRIAPLCVLLLLILSSLHFAGLRDFVLTAKTGGLRRALLAVRIFHINVLEARRGYLPGCWDILWSLSVAEMFYLFFLGRGAQTTLTRTSSFGRNRYSSLAHSFSYGAARLARPILAKNLAHLVERRPALSGFHFVLFAPRLPLGLGYIGLEMTTLAVGACRVVIAAQTQWKAPRLLNPLLTLGQRGYEVYLTHMFASSRCSAFLSPRASDSLPFRHSSLVSSWLPR